MNKLIAKKYIIPYIALFLLFRFIFGEIESYYIKNAVVSPHPIDVHSWEAKFKIDKQYVMDAKHFGYDHQRYFTSFFPLDLVFPVVYTLLFMSCLQVCTHLKLYRILAVVIVMGAIFDYLEDLSFATYLLGAGDGIATVVSYFTTIKTILLIANIFMALIWILVWLKQLVFKNENNIAYKR
ncbi:hypothetical protein A4D02_26905 [Niastella koreensis]|uniref:Uncharacterized protein n=2 Tax=Niastella koreensis TaxID=354356 RepID=G8TFN4_NIAKG|nr:hypothetical protein [Niastella koreensis]AEV99473.1 hypothetical protein Niako_3143 [Niastella koreensis GR20-10]OQP50068.1 hypothetical protein A4D02_26905 [Niastella koreensis]